ncbi:hypothetical protein CEUSTIGMA_g11010.t1 [Chlamydomonas eustigma]|uniref:HSA domain-containing protein n=1 Tax=Chlamydomonas eustigma TaxID=1157962 RepID=A0A250XKG7_9CHLO|nr:hypothetical protein CEUSTIGMA_g11010.t1 [Chlamydomonas eustigma]|eukprot:GAX83585.1 hypothetical protein CEUSTIGMA_g11010.t1 [Chlamydomonas eustigma]
MSADRASLEERANAIQARWDQLVAAYHYPAVEPTRGMGHWDYVLREGRWMADDFMQERLWKQAAAVRLCQEAARFKRSSLRKVETKVTQEIDPFLLGHVREDTCTTAIHHTRGSAREKRHSVPTHHAAAEKHGKSEEISGPPTPPLPDPFDFPSVLCFHTAEDLMSTVISQLEEEDVARLARHGVASAAYHAAYDAARWALTPEEEEAAVVASKAAAMQKRRAMRSSMSLVVPDSELGDYLDSAGGLTSTKAMRRAVGAAGGGVGRIASNASLMDNGMMLDEFGRERRKRKARDFTNDDEDFSLGMVNGLPTSKRDRLGRFGGTRSTSSLASEREITGGIVDPRARTALAAGGGLPRAPKSGPSLLGGVIPGQLIPRGPGNLPRLDALQRMPTVSGRASTAFGRSASAMGAGMGADRLVMWSSLDDNMLAAAVTEFRMNWALVADVLRGATRLSGNYRRPDMCKIRYGAFQRAIFAEQQPADMQQEVPAEIPQGMMQDILTKQQAKEVIASSLPVHEDVQRVHQDAVAALVLRSRQKKLAERTRIRDTNRYRMDQHPSHEQVRGAVLQETKSRVLIPLEINPDPPVSIPQQTLQQQQQQQGPISNANATVSGNAPRQGLGAGPAAAIGPPTAAPAAQGQGMGHEQNQTSAVPGPSQQQQQQQQPSGTTNMNHAAFAAMAAAAAVANAAMGKTGQAGPPSGTSSTAAGMTGQQQQQLANMLQQSQQQQAALAAINAFTQQAGGANAGAAGTLPGVTGMTMQQVQTAQAMVAAMRTGSAAAGNVAAAAAAQNALLQQQQNQKQAAAVAAASNNLQLQQQLAKQQQALKAAGPGAVQQQPGIMMQGPGPAMPGTGGVASAATAGTMLPGPAAGGLQQQAAAAALSRQLTGANQQQALAAAAAGGRFPGNLQPGSLSLNQPTAQQLQQQKLAVAAAVNNPAALQALQAKLQAQQRQGSVGAAGAAGAAAMSALNMAQQLQQMQQQQQVGAAGGVGAAAAVVALPGPQQLMPNSMQNPLLWQQQLGSSAPSTSLNLPNTGNSRATPPP